MAIWRLDNPLQNYAWGDTVFIPELLGLVPEEAKPVAEMWLGAHPKAASQILLDDLQLPLDQLITSNPEAMLGAARDLNSSRLPFLMKVLAAREPLSLQAHPDKEQARQGFQRENDLQIPLSAPSRNYRDDNHKPELICALTPLTALCGFRQYPDIIRNFQDAGLAAHLPSFAFLERFADLRSFQKFILQLMGMVQAQRTKVLDTFLPALQEDCPLPADIRETCLFLQQYHPYDAGVLAPLYLNLVTLQPGEALFLPAGTLHAYLKGAGIEVMANSDNVLRGGLSSKHVDLMELARVLSFSPQAIQKILPQQREAQVFAYASPAREFALSRLELEDGEYRTSTADLPALILCTEGAGTLCSSDQELPLARGASAFISADTGAYTLQGKGRFWLTTVPR